MKATIETDSAECFLVLVLPLGVRRGAPTTIETTGEEAPQSRPSVAKAPSNVFPLKRAVGE